LGKLQKDESAAVAATVALSLFGLIAVGGIAFDYARMATLDTELQNAADQAALAGVTQLDGTNGARTRATTAAQNLVLNRTRQANDGGAAAVGIPTVEFFTDANTAATSDANANRIRVSVAPRSVFYALTPITGLLQSGAMNASALAGLQTSICNVPPLYMAFDPASEDLNRLTTGTGVLLLGAESASQFGYLDNGKGGNGVRSAMSWDDQEGLCQASGSVSIQTGVIASVKNGFNTRFANGNGNGGCPNGGTCSPAANTTTFNRDSCHAIGTTPRTPVAPCTTVIGNGVYAGQTSGQTRYQRYKQLIGSSYVLGDDRRRLTVAVIPYGSFGNGSSGTPVTPTKWLDVFITEPITGNGNSNNDPLRFYVEVIGESTPAISGRRDVPYLIE
jgi:Putative Flp pilus-assembly TadE/G-like